MSSKAKKIYIIVLIILIVVIPLIFLGYNLFKVEFKVKNFSDKIEINYNSKYKEKSGDVCYGNYFNCKKASVQSSNVVDTSKLGTYKITYTYTYNNKIKTLTQTVSVVDKIAPTIEINEPVIVCPNGKVNKLDIKVTDNYDENLTDKIETKLVDKKLYISVTDSNKNISKKEVNATVEDKTSPVITINGSSTKNIMIGSTYTDEGATAIDNCDSDIKVDITSNVNTSAAGSYKVTYTAKDSSGNISTVDRIVNVKTVPVGSRIVYLTFDDGPSAYTSKLLDVLKKYNVKVTFFVTCHGSDDMILREYNEGHQIALHTCSHDYSKVYASDDAYFDDLRQISDRVKRITGYESHLIRFPGGSSNTVSRNYSRGIMSRLVKEVQNRGYYYFDWNVSSGDAGGAYTSDQVYNNVVTTLKEGTSVVLQHDVKDFSVDAVERIIQYANANGYTFKTLDETSYGAHHGVNN